MVSLNMNNREYHDDAVKFHAVKPNGKANPSEKIEKINGSFIFFILVLVSSVASNLFQFYWTSSNLFGGLSGVIYGLLGFCLIEEMESKYDLYGLPPALYLFMIVWLILGFVGILDLFGFGSVANFAHLGGLISGIIFAMIYKIFLSKT